MQRILVVDADLQTRHSLENALLDRGWRVRLAQTAAEARDEARDNPPDLVVLDPALPDNSGLEVLEELGRVLPKVPVIILSSRGGTDESIAATKMGAFDYVPKPYHQGAVLELVRQALETGRLLRSPVTLGQGERFTGEDALVGASAPMQELYKAIGRVAPTEATVLIQGESGTGKELVARAIFQHSRRADGPYVVINCAALPENLMESELFGYEKGAFTGADSRRLGKIERADHGTIFLDEVGELALNVQAKLLRLLENRVVERVGGGQPRRVDVRILAATNRDLRKMKEQGAFREDLYYRLNVITLSLPPLRERRGDVATLADYFLERVARELGVRNPGLTPDAYQALETYDWPGNVRELGNAMEKCLIFSRGNPISAGDVTARMGEGAAARPGGAAPVPAGLREWMRDALAEGGPGLLARLAEQFDRALLEEALEVTGGNHSRAARLLGVSRTTLLSRLTRRGLR
ncbi:MAG: sigma-54 dependent transcriptional regulator [Deltaproteobacteria bacterium]|nr:sigma-54 dependent transcriptional regulator [Deltaproteobacteria bacterium]